MTFPDFCPKDGEASEPSRRLNRIVLESAMAPSKGVISMWLLAGLGGLALGGLGGFALGSMLGYGYPYYPYYGGYFPYMSPYMGSYYRPYSPWMGWGWGRGWGMGRGLGWACRTDTRCPGTDTGRSHDSACLSPKEKP